MCGKVLIANEKYKQHDVAACLTCLVLSCLQPLRGFSSFQTGADVEQKKRREERADAGKISQTSAGA